MRAWYSLLLLFAFAAAAAGAGPQQAAAAALADVRTLPAAEARVTRYLYLPDGEQGPARKDFAKVLTFHVNSLSREKPFAVPRAVADGVWAVRLTDYRWDPKVYEKLHDLDPYRYDSPETVALLIATESKAALLRADWFFVQSARQVDRRNNEKTGAGYYDFLGLKKRDDLLKLAGLDEKVVTETRREVAAIIDDSGVAQVGQRQILIKSGHNGINWFTLDAASSEGDANALRLLDGDFKHAAEEWYLPLPNDLFALAAVKVADGTLQAVVPPEIAGNKASTNNDLRVHAGLSCIQCHVEGLRPFDDWARRFYKDDVLLTSPDPAKAKRLQQLYLTPIEDAYEDGQRVYARALMRLSGWKPKEAARAYAEAWARYDDDKVSSELYAAGLGVTPEKFRASLKAYAAVNPLADPILVGYLKRPEFRAKRTHAEEAYPLALKITRWSPP